MDDVLRTAKACRHYAMCKIDFLGGGVCASGTARRYVSFYPEGRMDLYAALAEGRIKVTEGAVDIAGSCDLCGLCDHQCYFVTEMRPSRVMQALKDLVERHVAQGGAIEKAAADGPLTEMRKIVGDEWATNDRAIAVTYAHDPGPMTVPRMPAYVVMPGSREEVSSLLKLFGRLGIPWAARGNGSQNAGLSLTDGAILDLGRMTDVAFDEKNWAVRVGPGVTAFDLQRQAVARGYRVNVAEPAAMVCGNVICSGIFSTFMAGYGTAGDNFVDAEVVAPDGAVLSLSDKNAPNLFAFRQADTPSPGVCTAVSLKLHPMTDDESGVLVPFESFEEALRFARDCAVRRIGLAVAVLGDEYASAFLAPTKRLAALAREAFSRRLGMPYLVLVVGDKYAIRSVREMGRPLIDQRLFRALALGLPALGSARWLDLLEDMSSEEPFAYFKVPGFTELAEAALAPSAAKLVQDVDPDLRAFFADVYARPEMTDLVWLNMFRILSSRMGREGQFAINIVYMPLDEAQVGGLAGGFKAIADRHGLRNNLGFLSPIDGGKRCLLEYDYFFDQTDPEETARMRQAVMEAGGLVMETSARTGTIRWIRHVVNQGFARRENLLYT